MWTPGYVHGPPSGSVLFSSFSKVSRPDTSQTSFALVVFVPYGASARTLTSSANAPSAVLSTSVPESKPPRTSGR
jgi:hypothetical protein